MTVYNLVSHTNTSVNALFAHADFVSPKEVHHRLVHGSFMRELYATIKTNTSRLLTVEFSAYQTAIARVSADGSAAAIIRSGQVKRFDDVQVEMNGRTVKITTAEWVVTASSKVKPSIVNATKCADGRCILNIAVSPRFDTAKTRVAPHGLMGQSYDGDDIGIVGAIDKYTGEEFTTSAMGEGAIEGVAQDYEMADKFGTDFAFSRFGKAFAAPRNVSALSGTKVKTDHTILDAKAVDDAVVD